TSGFTCPSASSNPACVAVENAEGGLDGASMTTTITPIYLLSAQTACALGNTPDGYVRVTVTYDVPIFAPFVDRILESPGLNVRTITAQVTSRVAPCGITQGR